MKKFLEVNVNGFDWDDEFGDFIGYPEVTLLIDENHNIVNIVKYGLSVLFTNEEFELDYGINQTRDCLIEQNFHDYSNLDLPVEIKNGQLVFKSNCKFIVDNCSLFTLSKKTTASAKFVFEDGSGLEEIEGDYNIIETLQVDDDIIRLFL